jgi:hypothetical protein
VSNAKKTLGEAREKNGEMEGDFEAKKYDNGPRDRNRQRVDGLV